MKLWNTIETAIDFVAEMMGRVGWVLILYCMVFGVTDVFLRYVMNSPSLWISTTLQVAMVLLACVGGIYALNDNAFVKLDLFYANFSAKKKAICDLITVVFTLLFLGTLMWKGYEAAMLSKYVMDCSRNSLRSTRDPLRSLRHDQESYWQFGS